MVRRRRSYRRYKQSLFKLKLKKQTVYTIASTFLFAFAGLILLSFTGTTPFLVKIQDQVTQYLGWGGFFLPILLVSWGFLFLKIQFSFTKPNVTIGLILTLVSLLAFTQAGFLGEKVWLYIESFLSAPGAFIILFGTLVIGITVLFNTSLDQLLIFLVKVVTSGQEFIKKYFLATFFKKKKKPVFIEGKGPFKVKGGDEKIVKSPMTLPPVPKQLKDEMVISFPQEQIGIWEYPPLSLLDDSSKKKADRGDVKKNASTIEKTLDSFGIQARVAEVNLGPAVTQYALEIASGTKLSKITVLSNDLALALAAPTGQVRIEAPIPGRSLVSIEIPNHSLEFVTLKRMLGSQVMQEAKEKLTVALGLNVAGNPVVVNIAKMPHVLIAGTTGAGKSVLINSWIASLLFRTTPSEVRLILVDPKRVELALYNGIPHLLTPVIVEIDKILSSLKWALAEMERRYKLFASTGVRNIDGYNELAGFQALPYIVILIDELADLMASSPVEVEDSVCRIAQMARATGIHLVVSTQRPSVDVLTGLIKANIPCRVAFNVSSMVDSRVIIDMPGAEKMLGRGDMLYIPPDQAKPSRIQGTYVSEKETKKLVKFLKSKKTSVQYTEEVTTMPVTHLKKGVRGEGDGKKDSLFEEAVRVVCRYDRASASLLQRRLSIGYARAARILDQLERVGIVGPPEGSKPREVLMRNVEEYLSQSGIET